MTSSTESSGPSEAQATGRARFDEPHICPNRFLTPRQAGALRSLQMGSEPWPHRYHELWDDLADLWMVRIGSGRQLTLTERGQAYPT